MISQNIGVGAAFLVASLCVLSVLDTSGKWLQHTGVTLAVVCLFRYAVHAVLLSAYAWHTRLDRTWKTTSPATQMVRGMMMVLSTLFFFKTLSAIPLAEATAINFTAPLVTMVLAPYFLGERLQASRWISVIAGLVGVLIVLRPGIKVDAMGALLALLTVLCFSFYQIATKRIAHEDPIVTNLWAGWIGTIIMAAAMPWLWRSPSLDATGWAVLLSTGVTGMIGHLLQVNAYKHAPANALAPYAYFQIISAVGMGWLVFNQLPDTLSYVGVAVIIAAGLYAILGERKR